MSKGGLADTGNVLDQQVPPRQKSDQGKLHDIGLSANNSLDCSLELFKLTGGGDH